MIARVPQRRFYGEAIQSPMHILHMGATERGRTIDKQGWTGRRVLGYKLPDWQRPEVWSDEQCVRFIESAFLGANIGAFMVNSVHDPEGLDRILLDGQQRLRSLERYWNDEFAITGDDGKKWRWCELTSKEQDHLNRIPFPWIQTQYNSEHLLRETYNRHNYGGTAHLISQMAQDAGDLTDAVPFAPRP